MLRSCLLAALAVAPSVVFAQQPAPTARPAAAPSAIAPTARPAAAPAATAPNAAQQAQLTKQNTEMTQAALRVAQMVDGTQVGPLWDGASSVAKKAVTREQFVGQIGSQRTQLGPVVGRGQGAVTRVKYGPGPRCQKVCTSTSVSRPGLPRRRSRYASWCRSAWTKTRPGDWPGTACGRRPSDRGL